MLTQTRISKQRLLQRLPGTFQIILAISLLSSPLNLIAVQAQGSSKASRKSVFIAPDCFEPDSPTQKIDFLHPQAQSRECKPQEASGTVYGIVGGAHGLPKVEVSYFEEDGKFKPAAGYADQQGYWERGILQALFQMWYQVACLPQADSSLKIRVGNEPVKGYWGDNGKFPGAYWSSLTDPQYESKNTANESFWTPYPAPCRTFISGNSEILLCLDENGVLSLWDMKSNLPADYIERLHKEIIALSVHPAFVFPVSAPTKSIELGYLEDPGRRRKVKACLMKVRFRADRPKGPVNKQGSEALTR